MRAAAPIDLAVELRRIPLLAELPRHHFADLSARAQLVRFDRDRPIIVEGEPLAGVTFVLNGLVKVAAGRLLVDVCRGPTMLVPSASVDGAHSPVSVGPAVVLVWVLWPGVLMETGAPESASWAYWAGIWPPLVLLAEW